MPPPANIAPDKNYRERAMQDAGLTRAGARRVVSKRLLYAEMDATGAASALRAVSRLPSIAVR